LSLVAQGRGGLDRYRTPGREEAGEESDPAEQTDGDQRDRRGEGRRAEELQRLAVGLRLDEGEQLDDAEARRDADGAAEGGQREGLQHQRPEHPGTARTERHLDSDLL